jgi:hypothetical protein
MVLMKSKPIALVRTETSPVASPAGLIQRLTRLHELTEQSDHVFGSPLGPFPDGENLHYLPHFVYFGPHSTQDTLRLAVVAGFGRHDLPATRALLAFIEGLTQRPDIGHGLNLSFFPVVNVLGLVGGVEERDLTAANWSSSAEPEIKLLSQDSRLRGYQGFVRVIAAPDDLPFAWVRSTLSLSAQASDVEVFTEDDFAPWPVRFHTARVGTVSRGPLSIAGELPFSTFEVELALPAEWIQDRTDKALAVLLKRLFVRYRAFQAYSQYL